MHEDERFKISGEIPFDPQTPYSWLLQAKSGFDQ